MVLSDRTIATLIAEGRIGIDPYDESLLQPSSVDVRVDRFFRVFHNARYPYIDVKEPQEELTEEVELTDNRAFILHPGEFVLGSTLERVGLPDDLVARLEGKSSLGRLGASLCRFQWARPCWKSSFRNWEAGRWPRASKRVAMSGSVDN